MSGTIRKVRVVNGTYYLENQFEGFVDPQGADPSAPNNSQPFLTSVATRALIFIEADNCIGPIHSQLRPGGEGQVVFVIPRGPTRDLEVELPGRFRLTAAAGLLLLAAATALAMFFFS